ncbi:MAG: capsule assembly Wzi family protein [Candidatus Neomarinimicrobiota bacterium]
MKRLLLCISSAALLYSASAQRYIPADPFDLMFYEKSYFHNGEDNGSLILRPYFKKYHNRGNNWNVTLRSEFFNNTGAPNLENTSDRWIGKGESFFSSLNVSYSGKYILFSVEPFNFRNQNEDYTVPLRLERYSKLNDNQPHGEATYKVSGLRETQFYLHYNGIGFGISNASMWWGPGIHSTLNMTNNTRGFKHLMIGTLREQRIRNVGLDVRYIFSEMDSLNAAEPYYTAFVFAATIHSDPVVTVGLSRTYLSGGNFAGKDTLSRKEAMLIPFKDPPFLKQKQTDPDDPESAVDIWDQTMSGYLCASFPESGLKLFLEYGRDDHAWGGADLRRQPDHTVASVIGLRKYGIFGNRNLTFGFEYANLIQTRYGIGGITGRKRLAGNWYEKWPYDYSSYDGRHWGAHSGPDSDDFTIYLGYIGDRFSIVPTFNYERHGVINNDALVWVLRPYILKNPETGEVSVAVREELREMHVNIYPEVKFEFRLDIRFAFEHLRFNLYYEREFVDNLEYRNQRRSGNVLWLGVEKVFENLRLPRLLDIF